jgi:predicted nucleic acid-binding protein
MMYLVDTNVVSELRNPKRTHLAVRAWVDSVASDELYLSAISLLELEVGALRMERRDPQQGALLRSWLEIQVRPAFSGRILPVDAQIAVRCAALHVPDPRYDRDSLVAATALVHDMTVVTRNITDFKPMGVTVLNPWES